MSPHTYDIHIHKATLTTHGHRVERRRRRQRHARADGFGRGGAATAWAAAALSARARRLPAQLERGQVRGTRGGAGKRGGGDGGGGGSGTRGRTASDGAEQRPPGRPLLCLPERAVCAAPSGAQGSVAARGRAAAVASRRAARARRGGQVIGRRVMGRRVTAPSDRRRAVRRSAAADLEGVRSATVGVGGRPSCGEEGGRQVRVVRVALHRPVERHSSRDRGPVRPARFVARYGSRPNKFGRSGDAQQNQAIGKGATGAAKFTPRGTTYVFVNVVVAPRYVARVQLGSGGL